MTREAMLAIGLPTVLATNGTVRDARGLTSINIDVAILDSELNIHQTDHIEGKCHFLGLAGQLILNVLRQGIRRQGAGGVTGVNNPLPQYAP